MSEKTVLLAATVKKQNEILGELLDVLGRQRDAIKDNKHAELQSLMSELRQAAVRCQAIETKRERVAEDTASELVCEATVSAILGAMPPGDEARETLSDEAGKLAQLVKRLKSEMSLLKRLMEEARTINEMMISEWQKLSAKFLGGGAIGTFDAKI